MVEKFTRQGNQIKYEVTVEDPEVLAEPWVMTPRTHAARRRMPRRDFCESEGTARCTN